jgi:hypothetical protein
MTWELWRWLLIGLTGALIATAGVLSDAAVVAAFGALCVAVAVVRVVRVLTDQLAERSTGS